jgi:hypothetical protein
VEGNIAVGAFFELVDFAGVEGLGIDVDADGALIVLGQIEDLMDRFERIYVNRICGIHFIDVGRHEPTRAGVIGEGVAVFHTEILDFEAADGSGHPAVLIAMIVNTGELTDFPADGHTLEEVIFENEIASVAALGEIKILVERFGANMVMDDEILDVLQGEILGRDGGEILDPVRDGELSGGEVVGH